MAGHNTVHCAACTASGLSTHLRVAGREGPEGLIPTTDRYGTALSDIVRCPSCGHMQLACMPSDAELDDAYGTAASEDYVVEEPGQRETARRLIARIERYVEPGALLDLGCWVGFLLAEARDRGWDTLGVEPSRFASTYAREQLDLEVITADLFAAPLGDRQFDAVVLGDVIEHLPRPDEALDRIASVLVSGGVLCMALPDAGSFVARVMRGRWWSVIPTHVQYFTRASLTTLLRRRGFEPLEFASAPKVFTVRYYMQRIEGYSQPVGRSLVRGAERVRVADRMWAPNFRDRMSVIARAPTG